MTRLLVGRIPHEQPCPGVFYRALLRSDRALAGAVVAHAESSGTTASCEAGEKPRRSNRSCRGGMPVARDVAVLAAMAGGWMAVGAASLRWSLRHARRTGTLAQY